MKDKHTLKTIAAAGVIGTLLLSATAQTWANGNTEIKPLALHKIMQDMTMNMQTITGAIASEDWDLATKTAPLIAAHPQPPVAEKMRILKFAGSDAGKFRDYDEKTHQAGQELKRAAARQDGTLVISAFAMLQNSCLACHRSFRKSFQEHFYEQR